MPFSVRAADASKYEDQNHWHEVYEGLISPAIQEAGMLPERDDKDTGSRLIVEHILSKIEAADLILCDLSSHNPNVFLELGWALRADRPYVLVKDELTEYNFDLRTQYTFEYSHRLQPRTLRRQMNELADVIRRTSMDHERRYSYVDRLSVKASAIQASKENPNTGLLLEIHSILAGSRSSISVDRSTLIQFPWPKKLRRVTDILNEALLFCETDLPENLSPAAERETLDAFSRKLGTWHNLDFQFSILDLSSKCIYHDWPELIGKQFVAIMGSDDQLFRYDAGAIAWEDHTSNQAPLIDGRPLRRNIALFARLKRRQWIVLVEGHHES
jgi:hypothetical protein